MDTLLPLISGVVSLALLVTYILIVVNAFKNNDTTMGIVLIITFFLCFLGSIIALVYGWMKSSEWGIKNIMLIYTACFVLSFLLQGAMFAMGVGQIDFQMN